MEALPERADRQRHEARPGLRAVARVEQGERQFPFLDLGGAQRAHQVFGLGATQAAAAVEALQRGREAGGEFGARVGFARRVVQLLQGSCEGLCDVLDGKANGRDSAAVAVPLF